MTCEEVERDLDAFVDCELEAGAAAAVGAHISGCLGCRGRVDDRQTLSRLLQAAPYFAASDRLRERVTVRAARANRIGQLARWTAAAAVLIIVVGSATALLWPRPRPADDLTADIVAAHVRSLMGEHLFDVRSSDRHTVKPWFLGKIDFAPPVVDLAAQGFPLAGGRLDYLARRAVAALVYQRGGHTINVFISPADGGADTGIQSRSDRGFHVRHWTHGGMAFRAVSDLNDAELTACAEALAREASRQGS